MDIKLLVEQHNNIVLTLISSRLYDLSDDKSEAYFRDEERSDLFFIYLNEYLNTKFNSPLDNKKQVSVFQLIIDYCSLFDYNKYFEKFIKQAIEVEDFFFKTRYYKYYISPYDIDLEISFAELINYQSNYSKHSFYHLSIIKKKLKNVFQKNEIENFENEDYNQHLQYFKDAVIDDRLNFNQTKILEVLGQFFLSYWDLINSPDNGRITEKIYEFIERNGRTARRDIEEPENMSDVEKFHWQIRNVSKFKRQRIQEYIPKTNKYLIEKETSPENMIEKNK